MVGTILTVLANTPDAEGQAIAEIARLKCTYRLEPQNVQELDALEAELKRKVG